MKAPILSPELTPYEQKAQAIAASLGLTVRVAFKGAGKCPPWSLAEKTNPNRPHYMALAKEACSTCESVHGDHYRVTLRFVNKIQVSSLGRPLPATVTFDFWGSKVDQDAGTRPGYYDVLACVASDASGPTAPDAVAREWPEGNMPPSQAITIAKWARRLQAFFTEGELASLQEVDG